MSHLVLIFLLVNFTIIEIFTGYVTLAALQVAMVSGVMDFTPLVAFIGAFIGEVATYFTYNKKATAENTQGGIIYDLAMRGDSYDEDAKG